MLHTGLVTLILANELGLRMLSQSNYQQQRNFLHRFLKYALGGHAGTGLVELGTNPDTVW